ncbi:hypothetical protein PMAYCL1PPCAC_25024, partial [Pristionchus mayeri]
NIHPGAVCSSCSGIGGVVLKEGLYPVDFLLRSSESRAIRESNGSTRKMCDSIENGETNYWAVDGPFDLFANRRKSKPVKYKSPMRTRKGKRSGETLEWVARPLVDAATAAAAADFPLKVQQQRLMRRRLLQHLKGKGRRTKEELPEKKQKEEGSGKEERESAINRERDALCKALNKMSSLTEDGEEMRKSAKCDFCYGLVWEGELNRHIKTAHGLQPRTEETTTDRREEENDQPVCVYPCNQCDDLFFSYDDRTNHMSQKHDHKPVNCPWCQEKFHILPDFINHCSTKHRM